MKRSMNQAMKRQKTVVIRQEVEEKPSVPRRIGRALIRFFAVIGVLVVISVLSGIVIGLNVGKTSHPSSFTLAYEFTGDPGGEGSFEAFLADPFAPTPIGLNEFLFKIRAAAKDERVNGMVVRIHDGEYSLSTIEEIHAAMTVFHAAGKTSLAYADSFGRLSNGTGEYLLARAFQEIWLAPQGQVAPTGFYAELPYYRDGLAKFGIKAEMQAVGDFKTGPESMTRQQMSRAQKTMLDDVLDNSMDVASRLLVTDNIDALFDSAPYTAQQALEQGLVQRIAPVWALEEIEDEDHIIPLEAYQPPQGKTDKQHSIALIRIQGVILDQGYAASPLTMLEEDWIDPEETAYLIRDVGMRDDISALIVQIDSPGGSPMGAELIRQALLEVRSNDMPVFVSMGAQAASGGYWIAADADRIWALPSTVTGSIGVYGGKFDLSGLWREWGVNWDSVGRGDMAGLWSMNKAYSAAERKHVGRELKSIYDQFIRLVANGRGMTVSEAEELSGGRVWTGVQAVENGLVDSLGGIQDVIDHARTMLAVEEGVTIPIQIYPHPETVYQRFFDYITAPHTMRMRLPAAREAAFMLSPLRQRALWMPPGLELHQGL